jgi:hypothetical protein
MPPRSAKREEPGTYAATGAALLALLALDGLVLRAGVLEGTWQGLARGMFVLDALAVGYWFGVHPFVRRWLTRPPY